MPSKTKSHAAADNAAQLQIPDEWLDQLVTGPITAGQVEGLFEQFKKALLERRALISRVTEEVMRELTAWQCRPMESMYPVLFFDALRVKIREDGVVRSKAVYLTLGAMFPATTLQICIVHLIRNSLDFASWKDRKALAASIKQTRSPS